MNKIQSAAIATVLSVLVFWVFRFGLWTGALTTVRTPLYWTLGHIAAWVFSIICWFGFYNAGASDD